MPGLDRGRRCFVVADDEGAVANREKPAGRLAGIAVDEEEVLVGAHGLDLLDRDAERAVPIVGRELDDVEA